MVCVHCYGSRRPPCSKPRSRLHSVVDVKPRRSSLRRTSQLVAQRAFPLESGCFCPSQVRVHMGLSEKLPTRTSVDKNQTKNMGIYNCLQIWSWGVTMWFLRGRPDLESSLPGCGSTTFRKHDLFRSPVKWGRYIHSRVRETELAQPLDKLTHLLPAVEKIWSQVYIVTLI
jgi:hypothetical protein